MTKSDNPDSDQRTPTRPRRLILPPRMRREITADRLMKESPRTLRTSCAAVREMIRRFDEFQRGGAGSWKFSDEERMECLREAIHLRVVLQLGILDTPKCMEIGWMADALLMLSGTEKFLPQIPCDGTREAKQWIEYGYLSEAVKDLEPFWKFYRPRFEDLHRLLHLHGLTRNPSDVSTKSADVTSPELDTTGWMRRCEAIDEVFRETEECVWTKGGCGKQLDKADPAKRQCNGLKGSKRRFNPDFVRSVALRGRNKALLETDGEEE